MVLFFIIFIKKNHYLAPSVGKKGAIDEISPRAALGRDDREEGVIPSPTPPCHAERLGFGEFITGKFTNATIRLNHLSG